MNRDIILEFEGVSAIGRFLFRHKLAQQGVARVHPARCGSFMAFPSDIAAGRTISYNYRQPIAVLKSTALDIIIIYYIAR